MVENIRYKKKIKDLGLINKYVGTHLRFPLIVYLDDMIEDSRSIGAGFMTSVLADMENMARCKLDDYNADILGEYIKYARSRGVVVFSLLDTLCGEVCGGSGGSF